MKTASRLFFVVVVAFSLGVGIYDVTHPHVADASGGGGSASFIGVATGTSLALTGNETIGGTLGVVGAVAITGAITSGSILTINTSTTAGSFTSSTGHGVIAQGGAGNNGVLATGGSTNGAGCSCNGGGTTGHGVSAGGGTGASIGGNFVGTATGYGVKASNTAGNYALWIDGDTTSPARGQITWPVADANPSGTAVVGDLAMITGPFLRVATATTPAWTDVSGLLTVTGGLTAHAGGGQASALAICDVAGVFVIATVGSAADSVKLPATPVVGQSCEVVNDAATNAMNLYPGSGDVLCVAGSGCLAADAATSVTVSQHIRVCRAMTAAKWVCF